MLKAFLAYGYIIISVLAFGQNDLVNLSDFNTEKLNELLVNYTNQLRVRKRKTALTYDPNLDAAAKNHAQYMAERNYLGHFQKNKSLKTVKDRVSILGGDADFVGENVQYVSLDYEIKKSKYRLTYSDLATILGDNWKNSKGHYANMIDDNYSGVSHQFVVKNGLLYVCQVFSSKPFEPVFEYQIGDGFHVKNKRACFNCKSTIKKYNKDRLHYGWYYISNDSLFYYNYKKINYSKTISIGRKSISLNFRKNNLKKIFNRKGKLSLDFVHMTQFDCNGNAAYDGALNYDGYFLGYIDKKSINEKNISNLNEVVQLYVGQIPKVKDENFQVDFFLTKKDRPCSQQRLVFIAPDYFEPREFFQLQHPEIKIGTEQIIRDSVSVKVPFLRNEIEADKKALAELKMVLRELKLDSSNVESASYTGIASIEGTKKINEQLIKKRASLIETLLSDYFPSIEMNYELIENFSDFRIAIQDKEGDKWLNASEEELRAYANKNKNKPKVAAMLDATRQSEVTILTQEFYSTVELSPTVENLKQLIVENEYAAALLVWQQLTKIALQGDSLISSNLIELEIPKQKEWRKVIWEQFILDLKINETIVTANKLNELYNLGAISTSTDFLIYRLMFNLFYENGVCTTDDFDAVFATIKPKNQRNWVQSLYLIDKYEQGNLTSNLGQQLTALAASGRFNAYQTYFVSQYIMRYNCPRLAFVLLEKFAKKPYQFAKLYQQYLKLSYYFTAFEDPQQLKIDGIVFRNFAASDPVAFCNLFKWYHIGVRSMEIASISKLYCKECL